MTGRMIRELRFTHELDQLQALMDEVGQKATELYYRMLVEQARRNVRQAIDEEYARQVHDFRMKHDRLYQACWHARPKELGGTR